MNFRSLELYLFILPLIAIIFNDKLQTLIADISLKAIESMSSTVFVIYLTVILLGTKVLDIYIMRLKD